MCKPENTQDHVAANSEAWGVVIVPTRPWHPLNLVEIWRYRELLYFLTWRDIKVRYKQTLLGAAWAILKPTLLMVVFAVFLGQMAGVPGADNPVFVYAGLLPWILFSTAMTNAGNSVVNSEQLITKVYFPRIIIPLAAVGPAIVDFFIAGVVLGILMMWYRVPLTWQALLLVVPTLLLVTGSVAAGTFLAALNVTYRDVRHIIPFLVQAWMFATPTIYMDTAAVMQGHQTQETSPAERSVAKRISSIERSPIQSPPGATGTTDANGPGRRVSPTETGTAVKSGSGILETLLMLNPLTSVVGFFRSAVLGGELDWSSIAPASLVILVSVIVCGWYFRHTEDSFADVI